MKKSILLTLFLLCMTGLTNLVSGQIPGANLVASAIPIAPCSNDPVQLSVTDLNNLVYFPTAYVSWNFGDGSYGWGQTVSHTYTTAGTYQVCAIVGDSLFGSDTVCTILTVEPICPPTDIFNGIIYDDANGNGVQDPGELGVPYASVAISPISAYVSANASGEFSIPLAAGSYTLELGGLGYYSQTQPSGGVGYSVTSGATGAINNGNDFGITPIPGQQDMRVNIWAAPHVPGFNRYLHVSYQNVGTQVSSGTISLTLDPNVTFVSADNGGTLSGSTVTWNYSGAIPGVNHFVGAVVLCNLSNSIGDILNYTAIVDPIVGDLFVTNNYDTTSAPVVASYDPNDKSVTPTGNGPAGEIAPGTPLTYTVRFQNTGNFPATFIFVRDTLDADLDWSTFRVLSSSHSMTYTQNSDKLQFYFDNINLPDSTSDEPNSHGYLRYSINPKSTLVPGDQITNSASIYFDFNPPVLTNTTLNTIWLATSVEGPSPEMSFELFPNPMVEQATIRFDAAGDSWNFTLTDLQGRQLMNKTDLRDGEIQIVRQNLPAGTYLFHLVSEGGKVATGKLIAQ